MKKIICGLGKFAFLFKKKGYILDVKKVLVIRLGTIGDVLMTTPFLKSLRKRIPSVEITYLTGNWSRGVLENNKYIDKILSFDDKIIHNMDVKKIRALINKIKPKKFDLVFILDKSYQWNLFAFFLKIPYRMGFDRKGEGFPNHRNVRYDGTKHEIDYYLKIGELVGCGVDDDKIELHTPRLTVLEEGNIKGKNKIGIAPGGAVNPGQSMPEKRWSKENYIKLISELIKTKGTIVYLFGGKEDRKINREIIRATNKKKVVDFAGFLNIQKSAAIMKELDLFITHDSGPMHIAAAAGVPLIALFGPTDPKRFAPKKAIVIRKDVCQPCYDLYGNIESCPEVRCMELITPKEVLQTIKQRRLL